MLALITSMYSLSNPSPRYRQLLGYYHLMHQNGFNHRVREDVVAIPPSEAFSGRELTRFVYAIRGLVRATQSRTILDYGSGKGKQYSEELWRNGKKLSGSVHDFWDVREITCYDPGISTSFLSEDSKFDGVIATNVIDHIPEEDVGWVIEQLFCHANHFVFCNVANFLAPTWLPSGENARVVRKSKRWWSTIFEQANKQFPAKYHCLAFSEIKQDQQGKSKHSTSYLHNCPGLILPGSKRGMTGRKKLNP